MTRTRAMPDHRAGHLEGRQAPSFERTRLTAGEDAGDARGESAKKLDRFSESAAGQATSCSRNGTTSESLSAMGLRA